MGNFEIGQIHSSFRRLFFRVFVLSCFRDYPTMMLKSPEKMVYRVRSIPREAKKRVVSRSFAALRMTRSRQAGVSHHSTTLPMAHKDVQIAMPLRSPSRIRCGFCGGSTHLPSRKGIGRSRSIPNSSADRSRRCGGGRATGSWQRSPPRVKRASRARWECRSSICRGRCATPDCRGSWSIRKRWAGWRRIT